MNREADQTVGTSDGVLVEVYENPAAGNTVFSVTIPDDILVDADLSFTEILQLLSAPLDKASHVTAMLDIMVRSVERKREFDQAYEAIMAHLVEAQHQARGHL